MLDVINIASIPVFLLIFVRVIAFFVTLPLFSYRTIPMPFNIGFSFFLDFIFFFLLIFVRVISFFVTLPLFSYRTIPMPFKIGFSFFLALIMFYTVDASGVQVNEMYIFLLVKEMLVGLLIGLIAYMILAAVQIAGGFIDFQMGFAIANVIDPQTGAQSPLTGQYFYIIALLFLLSVDGHHLLIDGIFYSYHFIPIDAFIPFKDGLIADFVIDTFNKMFLIAFIMLIPIVCCLFLVDVALGIIARTVPQLNVLDRKSVV